MTIKQAHGVCPHCGASIVGVNSNPNMVLYGSVVRKCQKCKEQYLDTRYQEYAITGIPENELSVMYDLKRIGILAVFFIISTVINLINIRHEGKYYIMLAVISVTSPLGIIAMIIDMIRIKTGAKGRKLEKKRLESVARLQDPDYAMTLYEVGYPVPAEYLPSQLQETKGDTTDFVSNDFVF